ncbi:hypothetical protein ERJ75_000685400 [Trypanosoma vivax]|nr:hypothetical protein ERJ75_000685400 [Trypanosoma vivax]
MDARVGSKGRAAGNERRGGTGQRRQVNRKHAAPASRRRWLLCAALCTRVGEGLGATKGQTAADFLVLCRAKRAADEAVLAATGAAVRVARCRDALWQAEKEHVSNGSWDEVNTTNAAQLCATGARPECDAWRWSAEATSGAAEVKKLAAEAVLAGADTEERKRQQGSCSKRRWEAAPRETRDGGAERRPVPGVRHDVAVQQRRRRPAARDGSDRRRQRTVHARRKLGETGHRRNIGRAQGPCMERDENRRIRGQRCKPGGKLAHRKDDLRRVNSGDQSTKEPRAKRGHSTGLGGRKARTRHGRLQRSTAR